MLGFLGRGEISCREVLGNRSKTNEMVDQVGFSLPDQSDLTSPVQRRIFQPVPIYLSF